MILSGDAYDLLVLRSVRGIFPPPCGRGRAVLPLPEGPGTFSEDVAVFVNGNKMRPNDKGTAQDFQLRGMRQDDPGDPLNYPGDRNAVKFVVAPALNSDICITIVSA